MRTALFLGLTAIVLWSLGEVLERVTLAVDNNVRKIMIAMDLADERADVVVLGNSVTLQSFNPAIVDAALGIESYNLATGGQSMIEGELILRNYLAHNEQPKLLILGLYVNFENSSYLNPNVYVSIDPQLRRLYRDRRDELGDPLPLSYRVFNALRAYRYRSVIEPLAKRLVDGGARVGEVIDGYVAIDHHRDIVDFGSRRTARTDVQGLRDLLALCRERGLPVVFFEPPNHPGFSEFIRGREQALQEIQEIVSADPNVLAFVSFNDEDSLDYADDEWFGINHLNRRGADRFNAQQLVPFVRESLSRLESRPSLGDARAERDQSSAIQ